MTRFVFSTKSGFLKYSPKQVKMQGEKGKDKTERLFIRQDSDLSYFSSFILCPKLYLGHKLKQKLCFLSSYKGTGSSCIIPLRFNRKSPAEL